MGLAHRLRARGVAPPPWEEALEAADRSKALAEPYRDLSDVDVPLPEPDGAQGFSPRGAVLVLRALDVEAGDEVLVAGPGGRYVAALARARGAEAARAASLEEAEGGWDRVLLTRERPELPEDVSGRLHDLGTILVPVESPEGLEVVKLVRSGDGIGEVHLGDAAPADDPWGSRAEGGATPPGTLSELLEMEAGLRRVWSDDPRTRRERAWRTAVDDVWRRDPPGGVAAERWDRARDLFTIGYALQQATDLETARDAYTASLDLAPSAEAHTFRGWAASFEGRYQEAIEDCKRAIDVDPTLGNPYNDIGCYLLELGRIEEAPPWFRDAAEAERYEAPHYPHLNLARVHLHRGEFEEAEAAVERCLEIEPGDPAAEALLRRIREERG